MGIKSVIKQVLPAIVIDLKHQYDRRIRQVRDRRKSARVVFSEIYEKNEWGGAPGTIFSGGGSRGPAADSYRECVTSFIRTRGVSSVVDIGCGDFHIGSQIARHVASYVGVDVVPTVVTHHQAEHGSDKVRFVCLDAAEDELPDGELCLVRQVLQHLSNAQIQRIISKIARYKYCIVTEHYPAALPGFVPNRDKPQGLDTRLRGNSAVVLNAPPFSAGPLEMLMSVPADEAGIAKGATIRSYLWVPRSLRS